MEVYYEAGTLLAVNCGDSYILPAASVTTQNLVALSFQGEVGSPLFLVSSNPVPATYNSQVTWRRGPDGGGEMSCTQDSLASVPAGSLVVVEVEPIPPPHGMLVLR
jgi:hypothetical protein